MKNKDQLIDTSNMIDMREMMYIQKMQETAHEYLLSFEWCLEIINTWYDMGLPDKVGVFLIEITPKKEADTYVWVVVGDIPSVYIDSSIKSGSEVINCYVELMEEWIEKVLSNKSVKNCYPIDVPPNHKFANMLKKRINFIKTELHNWV